MLASTGLTLGEAARLARGSHVRHRREEAAAAGSGVGHDIGPVVLEVRRPDDDLEGRMSRVLVTGSSGLVGSALSERLRARGVSVEGFDLRADGAERGDVRDRRRVEAALQRCDGVVHLAAVSRVIWGEQDPEGCRATNIGGLANVLDAAMARSDRPWVVFASSREVYGQPDHLPASEDAPLRPVNVYGRTKVEGERLIAAAAAAGLGASVVRLSNVYGSTADHADRVVPAFARAAVAGETLRVDGAEHTFDFTHIDDVTRGLCGIVDHYLGGGAALPPIHLLTGRATTLGELARLAIELAGTDAAIRLAPPRDFDVARFQGDPGRARSILGWSAEVSLRAGLRRLVEDFAALRRRPVTAETTR